MIKPMPDDCPPTCILGTPVKASSDAQAYACSGCLDDVWLSSQAQMVSKRHPQAKIVCIACIDEESLGHLYTAQNDLNQIKNPAEIRELEEFIKLMHKMAKRKSYL
jgi:hypothetical protein